MSGAAHGHDDHADSPIVGSADAGHEGHHGDSHDDEHGHDGEALGPLDGRAWGAAALGIAAGLLVVGVMWVTLHPA